MKHLETTKRGRHRNTRVLRVVLSTVAPQIHSFTSRGAFSNLPNLLLPSGPSPLHYGWEHTPSDAATSVVLPHRAVALPHWVCMKPAVASPQPLWEQLGRRKCSPKQTQWGDATARRGSTTQHSVCPYSTSTHKPAPNTGAAGLCVWRAAPHGGGSAGTRREVSNSEDWLLVRLIDPQSKQPGLEATV